MCVPSFLDPLASNSNSNNTHSKHTHSHKYTQPPTIQPRWDQSTFEGRARHFFTTTNPLNVLVSDAELDKAKELVDQYRAGKEPANTTDEEVWEAKHLYDSAFHPETGEKVFLPGRMSFQVPGNMVITGCMMQFYRSIPAVVFWQWVNQSFNAVVNYSNRNASAGVTTEQLGQAYVAATVASVATAVGFNRFIASRPHLSQGMIGRFVPLLAVAAANCVNIPLMRQRELVEGIDIKSEDGVVLGKSKEAAKTAVAQVVPSRILMATPGMFFPPFIMKNLEQTAMLRATPALGAPIMVAMTGLCLSFSTPLCCALFPQEASIKLADVEPELQEKAKKMNPVPQEFFYNKGL